MTEPGGAQIVSTGASLPGEPISNDAIEALVGPLPEGLLAGMHMRQRHWIVDPETGEHRDSTSSMAAAAVREGLERADLEPQDLDLLITASASPDQMLPPLAAVVQDRLGITRCMTFDLRSGGAGVVQGLEIARLLIERGLCRTAAVVGSDAISPLQAQLFLGGRRLRVRDRLMVYMFGDGAGAIVLQAAPETSVLATAIAGIGTGRTPGMEILGGGGTHAPYLGQLERRIPVEMRIDIEQASSFTATLMTAGLADVLERAGASASSVDLLVTPEADTAWMAEALQSGEASSEWDALRSRVFNVLPELGAPGCAALPLGLDRAWTTGRLSPGDRVLLLGMETTMWIYAAMLLQWTAKAPSPSGA